MTQYYGYRCYDENGNPIGWLYTTYQDGQLNWTKEYLDWCKRWKTERGAKKNFDWYNGRWKFHTGGYLKIEIMPEISIDPYKNQQKWQEEHPESVKQSKAKYDSENPVWSIRLKPEVREWLEQHRLEDAGGKVETNAALINRILEILMKLEQQKF